MQDLSTTFAFLSAFLMAVSLIWGVSGCGGSGGGGSSDLSCAPATPSTPTVDLSTAELGQWTLTLTETSSTCDSPPDSITCQLDMTVSGNDVTISGTCTSVADTPVTVTFSDTSGIVSGDTLYWGTTMSATVGDYTETDTVPCTDVQFTSSTASETFSVTVAVAYNNDGETGTCSTTFSGRFGGF